MKSQSFVNQNHTELRFCFWNIGGLHDKMEDELFLYNIKNYDSVLLAETHIGYDKNVAIEGFHYFPFMQSKICKWQILWRTSNFNSIKNTTICFLS